MRIFMQFFYFFLLKFLKSFLVLLIHLYCTRYIVCLILYPPLCFITELLFAFDANGAYLEVLKMSTFIMLCVKIEYKLT